MPSGIPQALKIPNPFDMSILFYRRPDYVAKVPGPMSLSQCQLYVERTQKHRRAIPPELSFENVIQNRALPVRPEGKVESLFRELGLTVAAMCSTRFHGLPSLYFARCGESSILAMASGLHQKILCSTEIGAGIVTAMVSGRSTSSVGQHIRSPSPDVRQEAAKCVAVQR